MPIPPSSLQPSTGGKQYHRLLARSEMVTLLGMVFCIFSLFLDWSIPLSELTSKLPTLPMVTRALTRIGAGIPAVRWPLTFGSVFSGSTLLFTPNEKNRVILAVVQGLSGLVCFVVAITHFAVQAGSLVALVGGALLTFGAVDRFVSPLPTNLKSSEGKNSSTTKI